MKKHFTSLMIFLLAVSALNAQVFRVDTLRYHGDINKYINIVIMGDGYTASQQSDFIADASSLTNYLFAQSPWSRYKNYFNVFAIRVISAQSGITHPANATDVSEPVFPVANLNTYFNCTFDYFGVHRLVVAQNTSGIASVLATNFPNYDQVLIVANSDNYGGSGGAYAVSTVNESSKEITAHEIGHSFARLADEYYAGDIYAAERANMTKQTNPALVKWSNWMGDNGVGIYQHGSTGQSALWYRPHDNCKMRILGPPYCSVCAQTIVESIHDLVNPVVSYLPTAVNVYSPDPYLEFKLTELIKPSPNTLNIQWKLDGSVISQNMDSLRIDQNALSTGTHALVVTVTDTSELLRINNHATIHVSTVTWTIYKLSTGVELTSAATNITYAVYPNPTTQFLNIEFEVEKKSKVSINLIAFEGKIIQRVENKTVERGNYTRTLELANLAGGTYSLVVEIDQMVHTQTIVKQ